MSLPLRIALPQACDADVVIVGAGPAGAAAATHLSRAGWRVILVDRQRFPRDKVCGDFVGPVALLELERLGVSRREGYCESNIIRRAARHADGKVLIDRAIPALDGLPDYGRCIPRLVLDDWIVAAAQEAGAQILEQRKLGLRRPQAATLQLKTADGKRTLTSRLIIGADGSSSTIARELRGGPPPDASRIIAIRAYYEGDAGPEDRADLYFASESFPGYYWLFPTGRGMPCRRGNGPRDLPPTTDHLRDLMLRLVERDPALGGRLSGASLMGKITGWPLSTYDPSLPIVGERVMLCGDAAGFINPLNGEGIQYALLSGRWAAERAGVALTHYAPRARLGPYAAVSRAALAWHSGSRRIICSAPQCALAAAPARDPRARGSTIVMQTSAARSRRTRAVAPGADTACARDRPGDYSGVLAGWTALRTQRFLSGRRMARSCATQACLRP
jgi:geranylgeranyl reductase family protein